MIEESGDSRGCLYFPFGISNGTGQKMPIILQVTSISGTVIEGARWEVEFPAGIQEGQDLAISVPVSEKDNNLVGYIIRSNSKDVIIDKDEDNYSVVLSCQVGKIRHMVESKTGNVSTMCTVVPVNKLADHVLTYLFAPNKCSASFLKAVGNPAENS